MDLNYMNITEMNAITKLLTAVNEILPRGLSISIDTVAVFDTNGEKLGHIHYEGTSDEHPYVFYMGEQSPKVD